MPDFTLHCQSKAVTEIARHHKLEKYTDQTSASSANPYTIATSAIHAPENDYLAERKNSY